MPSRKQRRRRAKERRHEYEYVYVDEEGREVEPPPEEAAARRDGKSSAKAAAKARPKASGRRPASGSARVVPPPSWSRVLKRGALFAPFMLITLYLLGGRKQGVGIFVPMIYLLILFIPFSYLVDRAMYRRYLRQTGQVPDQRPGRRQS